MLTKNEQFKYAMINSKAQVIFIDIIVNVIFKYGLQIKIAKDLFNNDFSVFGHIKAHYGCYEIAKNGNLNIHTLLWINDFLDPNTLHDDKIFR
jgi:hypothetical protein